MAFHPVTGDLWIIENEPRGGDELNIIKPGKNYGFPLISYGRDNDGKLLNGGLTQKAGLEQPVYFWTPSVAFSGMTFYTGDKLPKWKNSIFAGGLSGMQLVRLELSAGRPRRRRRETPPRPVPPHPRRAPGPGRQSLCHHRPRRRRDSEDRAELTVQPGFRRVH
jgi:glucose/arabinose dehydrogenase